MAEPEVELARIYLFRTSEQINSTSKKTGVHAMGERGIMVVGNNTLYTIERTGGFVRLPKGEFICKMEQHKRLNRVFRVRAGGEYGHNVKNHNDVLAGMLIHAAMYPHNIEGCIAPGRTYINNGINASKGADG